MIKIIKILKNNSQKDFNRTLLWCIIDLDFNIQNNKLGR